MDYVVQILTLLITLVGALTALVVAFKAARIEKKTEESHKAINGRLSELLEAKVAAARAEGYEAGRVAGVTEGRAAKPLP